MSTTLRISNVPAGRRGGETGNNLVLIGEAGRDSLYVMQRSLQDCGDGQLRIAYGEIFRLATHSTSELVGRGSGTLTPGGSGEITLR